MREPKVVVSLGIEDTFATAYRSVTEYEFRQLMGAMLTAMSEGEGIAPDYKHYCLELGEYFANDDPIGDPDLDYSLLGTFQTVAQYLE
jgi:hypothetical protein